MAIESIAYAIVAGITYALTGYGKNSNEEFNWVKFGTPVVIGVFTGLYMWFSKTSLEMSHQFILNLGLVTLIEQGLKTIKRRILKTIKRRIFG